MSVKSKTSYFTIEIFRRVRLELEVVRPKELSAGPVHTQTFCQLCFRRIESTFIGARGNIVSILELLL